ncbi:MAG: hypothetical protein PHE43_03225 [Candidatus Nanoarchaeia archaeon]|nr:hypothetical protein [Candidatus Nanoarchaeia archaeon]
MSLVRAERRTLNFTPSPQDYLKYLAILKQPLRLFVDPYRELENGKRAYWARCVTGEVNSQFQRGWSESIPEDISLLLILKSPQRDEIVLFLEDHPSTPEELKVAILFAEKIYGIEIPRIYRRMGHV